jgi:hypothetical protein
MSPTDRTVTAPSIETFYMHEMATCGSKIRSINQGVHAATAIVFPRRSKD